MFYKNKYRNLYEGSRRGLFFLKNNREPKKQDAKSIETFRQKYCYRTELWKALCQKAHIEKGMTILIHNLVTFQTIHKIIPKSFFSISILSQEELFD